MTRFCILIPEHHGQRKLEAAFWRFGPCCWDVEAASLAHVSWRAKGGRPWGPTGIGSTHALGRAGPKKSTQEFRLLLLLRFVSYVLSISSSAGRE